MMDGLNFRRILKLTAAFLVFTSALHLAGKNNYTPQLLCIKSPEPTCVETIYTQLQKVGEIKDDGKTKNFLVSPRSLVVSDSGYIFVFDSMKHMIFKFDSNLKFVTAFGSEGRGPGDVGRWPGRNVPVPMSLGTDGLIYVGDRSNGKFLTFSTSGEFKKEYRMWINGSPWLNPVLDREGNFILYSQRDGILDIYNRDGKFVRTLGKRDTLSTCLFYKLSDISNRMLFYHTPGRRNVMYDVVADNQLAVYLSSSGFYYLLKEDKMAASAKLWPKNLLNIYQKKLRSAMGDNPKHEGYAALFQSLTVDGDDDHFFYLFFPRSVDDDKSYIYKFDIYGDFKKVLYVKEPPKGSVRLLYKKKGLFYVVGRDADENQIIMTYKEDGAK